jgi:hypothetical protein
MTSADYAVQAVKGIKKSYDNAQQYKLDMYMDQKYLQMYNTDETSEIFTSTEGMSGVEELGELTTPPSLKLEDGYSVTINEKRWGGAIVIPETTYRRTGRDPSYKVDKFLKRQRKQLLKTNTHKLITQAHLMLNEAFDSTSVYLAPDSVEVIGAHTWNSGGTFDNSTTEVFSQEAADNADEWAGEQTDPAGKERPLTFTCIVAKKGSEAAREATRIYAKEIVPTAVNDINIYEGELDVITTPFILSARKLDWFMMDLTIEDSPLAVGIGEYPTMREPIKERNEAIRANCTGFWKQGVLNMPYNMYAGDGTA